MVVWLTKVIGPSIVNQVTNEVLDVVQYDYYWNELIGNEKVREVNERERTAKNICNDFYEPHFACKQ